MFEINVPQESPAITGFAQGQSLADAYQKAALQKQMAQQQMAANQQALQQSAQQFPLKQKLLEAQVKNVPLQQQLTQATIQQKLHPQATGLVGQIQSADNVGKQYGYNSPQFIAAQNAVNSQIDAAKSKSGYYTATANYRAWHSMTPQQQDQADINLGRLGYPAGITGYVTQNGDFRNIIQNQIPYSDWVKSHENLQTVSSPVQQTYQPTQQMYVKNGLSNTLPQMNNVQTTQSAPIAATPPTTTPVAQNFQYQATGSEAPDLSSLVQNQLQQSETALDKKLIPQQQQNRIYAGNRFEVAMNNVAKLAPLASEYSGLSGTAKREAAKFGNSNHPAYLAYLELQQSLQPAINDYAILTGARSTDMASKEIQPVFDLISWKNSPSVALAKVNNLIATAKQQEQQNVPYLSQQLQQTMEAPPARVGTSEDALKYVNATLPDNRMGLVKDKNGNLWKVSLHDMMNSHNQNLNIIG